MCCSTRCLFTASRSEHWRLRSLCSCETTVTVAALVLVFVGAISAWPVYQYGESAYDRVKSMSDAPGEQWLDEHMARGEKMIWLFYVLAGVAAIGVGAVLKWPRTSFPITVGTLILAGVTLGTGG